MLNGRRKVACKSAQSPFKYLYLPRYKFFFISHAAQPALLISANLRTDVDVNSNVNVGDNNVLKALLSCCCFSCFCALTRSVALSLMRAEQKFYCCCCRCRRRRWLFTIFKLLSHLFGAKTLKHNIKNSLYDIVELLF